MSRLPGTEARGRGLAAPSSTSPAVAGRDGLRVFLYQITRLVRPAEERPAPSSAAAQAFGHPCPRLSDGDYSGRLFCFEAVGPFIKDNAHGGASVTC
jgi:hypothetical protein